MSDGINDSYSGRIMDADKPPVSDAKMSADEEMEQYCRQRWPGLSSGKDAVTAVFNHFGTWSALYSHTKKHEQAIADLREEMKLLGILQLAISDKDKERWDAMQRIYSRLQAALDELLRGFCGGV